MIATQCQLTESIYDTKLRFTLKDDTKSLTDIRETNEAQKADEKAARGDAQTQKTEKYKCFLGEFDTPLYWGNISGIILLHLLSLYYIATFKYSEHYGLIVYTMLMGQIAAFGITAGAHRYWTHRCFKATLPLRIILIACYSLAGQNTILEWVRDHRVHHKFSETDADPHNSNRGFFFSHVGWLCMKKHPEVLRKGKLIDVSDVCADPLVAFNVRHWALFKTVFCFILPTIIPPILFGEFWMSSFQANIVRYCLSLNCTWSVNSFAHIYGNKPFNKNIQPVENLLVSVVSFGEGWHNYHHSFPWDYRAAELGSNPNFTTFWLDLFAKLGWAYDLKTTSIDLINSMANDKGDGSHRPLKE